MLEKAAAKRFEKVENLQHGVTIRVGNVGFQAGERRPVVQAEIKIVQTDFRVFQFDFLISLGNGDRLVAVGRARVRTRPVLRRNAVVIGATSGTGFPL